MHRWLIALVTTVAISCASDAGNVNDPGQTQTPTPAPIATPAAGAAAPSAPEQPLASPIPTRTAPMEKVEELTAALAQTQPETTAEELSQTYSYLQEGIGSSTCAYTDRCGSGGGRYSGCVFGYCAWCQTWALCHYEDGTPNYDELAICDPGPCKKR